MMKAAGRRTLKKTVRAMTAHRHHLRVFQPWLIGTEANEPGRRGPGEAWIRWKPQRGESSPRAEVQYRAIR